VPVLLSYKSEVRGNDPEVQKVAVKFGIAMSLSLGKSSRFFNKSGESHDAICGPDERRRCRLFFFVA
jgi:hypothetical protein